MVKKGSGSSKKKNISKKKGVDTQNIAPSPDISEKPPETPKKKPSVRELLLQQFDVWQPEKLFSGGGLDVRAERAWRGTARFPELVRFSREPFPVIGIVHACAIIHSQSPCRKPCSSARSGSFRSR